LQNGVYVGKMHALSLLKMQNKIVRYKKPPFNSKRIKRRFL